MAVPPRTTCLTNAAAAANRAQKNAEHSGNPSWVRANAELGQLWLALAATHDDPINAEDAMDWTPVEGA